MENPEPDVAFAIRTATFPANALGYCSGDTMAASELVKIEVHSMGVHGSKPWMGKEPLTVAAEIIVTLGQAERAAAPKTPSLRSFTSPVAFTLTGEAL